MLTVKILGQKYTIEYLTTEQDPNLSEDTGGYVERFSNRIIINASFLKRINSTLSPEQVKECENSSLRHEIIHAFFIESGLDSNFEHKPIGQEETVVDWFALQFPKILKVFKKVGCI